jgi:hypothetical protein
VTHPLDGVRLKIERARHHFYSLKWQIDSFVQSDEGAMVLGVEPNADRSEWKLRCVEVPQSNPSWSVEFGEFLYQLRTALDHLAWQLVLAGGATPNASTEFPVFHNEADFDRRAESKTKGMASAAIATIKELQPYNAWPEHPKHSMLWKLHELCNLDKHRFLHLTDFWTYDPALDFTVPFPAVVTRIAGVTVGRLKSDTELASYTLSPAPGGETVDVHLHATFGVGLAEGECLADDGSPAEGIQVEHVMVGMLNYVESTLLPKFVHFFSPP